MVEVCFSCSCLWPQQLSCFLSSYKHVYCFDLRLSTAAVAAGSLHPFLLLSCPAKRRLIACITTACIVWTRLIQGNNNSKNRSWSTRSTACHQLIRSKVVPHFSEKHGQLTWLGTIKMASLYLSGVSVSMYLLRSPQPPADFEIILWNFRICLPSPDECLLLLQTLCKQALVPHWAFFQLFSCCALFY